MNAPEQACDPAVVRGDGLGVVAPDHALCVGQLAWGQRQ